MLKKLGLTVLLLLIVFSLIPIKLGAAQSSASQQVYLPVNQLNFVGQQGTLNLTRTLVVVGITNQTINVTMIPTDLYDSSDGYVIPANSMKIDPSNFPLQQTNQTVNISISTSRSPVGTYQGAIALTSTNTANTTITQTTTVNVTVNIEPLTSSLNQQQVYLPINQLNFIGEQGTPNLNRTLVVVGLANQTVNVTLVPTDLYDNTTNQIISANSITIQPTNFSLPQTNMTINISINTSGVTLSPLQTATFQGAIILTSSNATAVTITNIPIIVKIQQENFHLYPEIFIPTMLILIILSLIFGEIETIKFRFTKFLVIILGMGAAGVYFYLVLTTSLIDTGNVISTALIAPFIAYLIYYVKDLRDDRKSLQTAAQTIRNANIGKDVDILTNLMGELTTHFASFTTLYHKDGTISSDTWKKQRKEGTTSDFPLLRIEQYYSYISIYNNYYEAIYKYLSNDKKATRLAKLTPKDQKIIFREFYNFREKYSELENLLFINLQYDLGALTILDLSPLQMEYPRITRVLLYALIDSEALVVPIIPEESPKLKKALRSVAKALKRKTKDETLIENFEALKTLQSIQKKNPNNENLKVELEIAQKNLALTQLQSLAEKDQKAAKIAINTLNALTLDLKNSEALKILENIYEKNPTDEKVKEVLEQLQIATNKSFEKLSELGPEKPEAQIKVDELNTTTFAQEDFAFEALQRIHNIDSHNEEVKAALENVKKKSALTYLLGLAKKDLEIQEALPDFRKNTLKEQIKSRSLRAKDLKKICKNIYRADSTEKFLGYIDVQFSNKIGELEKIAIGFEKILPLPDQPDQPKDGNQIKGIFTFDAKNLKDALGKGDENPPKDETKKTQK